jgi:hypothetical protein
MPSKLFIALVALALLFGLSMPANAQGYWGMYSTGYAPAYQYGPAYHPADAIPYFSPYQPSGYYYLPYFAGSPYDWWWWISWRR